MPKLSERALARMAREEALSRAKQEQHAQEAELQKLDSKGFVEWQQDMQGRVAEAQEHQQAAAADLHHGQQHRNTGAQTQQHTHDEDAIIQTQHSCKSQTDDIGRSGQPVIAYVNGCNAQDSASQPPSTTHNPPDKLQPAAKRLCV